MQIVILYAMTERVCKICNKAKEKLELLGVKYKVESLEKHNEFHDNWRQERSWEVKAASEGYGDEKNVPLMRVEGDVYNYPEGMGVLRKLLKK